MGSNDNETCENDIYTLTVSTSLTSQFSTLNYLHLIDNIAGEDIDLLATPSYTFLARNDDFPSRFRLVFKANENNNDNEDFAFISNGDLIINGMGTLQIFDVLGRNLITQEVSAVNYQLSTLNLNYGVYVLQLNDGSAIKTQKIIIK